MCKLSKSRFTIKQANLVDYVDMKLKYTDIGEKLESFTVRGITIEKRVREREGKFDFEVGGRNEV